MLQKNLKKMLNFVYIILGVNLLSRALYNNYGRIDVLYVKVIQQTKIWFQTSIKKIKQCQKNATLNRKYDKIFP